MTHQPLHLLHETQLPPGAHIAPRVHLELQRKEGQPCPSEFAVPERHINEVGHRTRPVGLPKSHLMIPPSTKLSVDFLWEQQCKTIPHNQKWGLAWMFHVPKEPNVLFNSITVVFIGAYKTKRLALSVQQKARGMYPNRVSMVFKLGYWQALPVPRWLDKFKDIDDYNGEVIKRHMRLDFKKTDVEHEVLRRRAHSKSNTPHDSPEIATEKIENLIHGDHTQEIKQCDDAKLMDKWDSTSMTGLLSKKQKIGLAWSLPSLQCRGRVLKDLTVAWLGVFQSVSDAVAHKTIIEKHHPEWHIHSFEVGQPLELPVPFWKLQQEHKMHYEQNILNEFMRTKKSASEQETMVYPLDMNRQEKEVVLPTSMESDDKHSIEMLFPSLHSQQTDNENDSLVSSGKFHRDVGHGLTIDVENFKPSESHHNTVCLNTSESDSKEVSDCP